MLLLVLLLFEWLTHYFFQQVLLILLSQNFLNDLNQCSKLLNVFFLGENVQFFKLLFLLIQILF